MATTLKLGDTYTTAKSKVVGVIQEIKENANGSKRIKLDVGGTTRWTTAN